MGSPRNRRVWGFTIVIALLYFAPTTLADWPMPGHDAQRTSWASEDAMPVPTRAIWAKKFDPFLPASVQIVTSSAQNKIYVTAADGIYALDPATGAQVWKYAMSPPPGNAPTYAGGTLYVAGTDKTVHAIDAATGAKRWQTAEAGMGFYANPLVVANRVYVGSLDGYFYCFDAATGGYVWSFNVGAPIQQSAAYQAYAEYPNGVIFFAAQDLRGHALRADTGAEIWKSAVLIGAERFQVYWPVVFDEVVFLVGGTYLPSNDNASITNLQRDGMKRSYSDIPTAGNGWYNFQHHQDWQAAHPYLRTTFILDRRTGSETLRSPFMHSGPQQGYRSPPVVGPNPAGSTPPRLVWSRTPWHGSNDDFFGFGRFMGWSVGTSLARLIPGLEVELESADEGESYSIIGNQHLYSSKGIYGEGGFQGGVFPLAGGNGVNLDASALGNIDSRMGERKYNYGMNDGNAPVPLNGRVYLHKDGTVLCFGQ